MSQSSSCLEALKHVIKTAFFVTHRASLNRREVPDYPCILAYAATRRQHTALERACWRQTCSQNVTYLVEDWDDPTKLTLVMCDLLCTALVLI